MLCAHTNTCCTTLIADSGSTKTEWLLCVPGETPRHFFTQGINPFMIGAEEIRRIIREELLSQMPDTRITDIRFYGAGCRAEKADEVARALHTEIPDAEQVTVESDLAGAAWALFGQTDGIACILGTGSNSGLYIGEKIIQNVSPLGFILGDEGSGAVLGRRLVGNLLKQQMPEKLREAFLKEYGLSPDSIIQHVYREAFPNRFLASFAPFIHKHRTEESVQSLLADEFSRFFRRNVCLYERPDLPVSFVGSIAYYFETELRTVAAHFGYTIGTIKKSPLGD